MSLSSTPSFITEIPLKIDTYESSVLKKRFWAAKQQYNALLGEAIKRLNAMRQDKKYTENLQLYKQKREKAAQRAMA